MTYNRCCDPVRTGNVILGGWTTGTCGTALAKQPYRTSAKCVQASLLCKVASLTALVRCLRQAQDAWTPDNAEDPRRCLLRAHYRPPRFRDRMDGPADTASRRPWHTQRTTTST